MAFSRSMPSTRSLDEAADKLVEQTVKGDDASGEGPLHKLRSVLNKDDDLAEIPKLEPIDIEVKEYDPSVTDRELRRECAEEGHKDQQNGAAASDNPYQPGSDCWQAWLAGYHFGQAFGVGLDELRPSETK